MASSELLIPAQFIFHPLASPLSLIHLELPVELTSNVKQGKLRLGKENFLDSDSR